MSLLRLQQKKYVIKVIWKGKKDFCTLYAIWVSSIMINLTNEWNFLLNMLDLDICWLYKYRHQPPLGYNISEEVEDKNSHFHIPLGESVVSLEYVILQLGLLIDEKLVTNVSSDDLVSLCEQLLVSHTMVTKWFNQTMLIKQFFSPTIIWCKRCCYNTICRNTHFNFYWIFIDIIYIS